MVFTGAYFYDLKKYVPTSPDMGGPKKKPNLKKRLQKIVESANKKGFLQTLRRAVEKREKV